jgi:hypothetical protein
MHNRQMVPLTECREYARKMEQSMSGPSPDDFRAKVFRDRVHPDDWRVEKLCDDGESEVAICSGEDARQRAIRYAAREYGDFE